MLQNIASNIIRLHGLVIPLDIKFDQFRDKVEKDFQMQRQYGLSETLNQQP